MLLVVVNLNILKTELTRNLLIPFVVPIIEGKGGLEEVFLRDVRRWESDGDCRSSWQTIGFLCFLSWWAWRMLMLWCPLYGCITTSSVNQVSVELGFTGLANMHWFNDFIVADMLWFLFCLYQCSLNHRICDSIFGLNTGFIDVTCTSAMFSYQLIRNPLPYVETLNIVKDIGNMVLLVVNGMLGETSWLLPRKTHFLC